MASKYKRIYTFLGTTFGTALAVYGIRRGMQWYQQRQMAQERGVQRFATGYPHTEWPEERRYQPVDQPDREAIPATGGMTAAPPMTGQRDRADEFTTTRDDDTFTDRFNTRAGTDRAGDTVIGDYTPSPAMDQEEEPLLDTPTNRMSPAQRDEMVSDLVTSDQTPGFVMDDYVAPLIEHAIAFHSVMNLLRSRQRDGEGHEGTESLTEGDRHSMRAVLDQMQEHAATYDEAKMGGHPLAKRSYNLTSKLRDALDNLDYTGADLFRIYGEVQPELCRLANELDQSGEVTITGLDHIRQLYECK